MEEVAKREEEEEKEREVLRVISRRVRDQEMAVGDMVDEDSPSGKEGLVRFSVDSIDLRADEQERFLKDLAEKENSRQLPEASTSAAECYAEKDALPAEVQRLKAAFKGMTLRANAKVTTERVYSMVVHPEKTKTVVLVGDKYGQVGM